VLALEWGLVQELAVGEKALLMAMEELEKAVSDRGLGQETDTNNPQAQEVTQSPSRPLLPG
jgi:hypothetical protein